MHESQSLPLQNPNTVYISAQKYTIPLSSSSGKRRVVIELQNPRFMAKHKKEQTMYRDHSNVT